MQKKFKVTVNSKLTGAPVKNWIVNRLPNIEMFNGSIHYNINGDMMRIESVTLSIEEVTLKSVFSCAYNPNDNLAVGAECNGKKRISVKQRKFTGEINISEMILRKEDIIHLIKKLQE